MEKEREEIKTKFNNTSTYNIDPALNFLLYGKTLMGKVLMN